MFCFNRFFILLLYIFFLSYCIGAQSYTSPSWIIYAE